MLVNKIERRDTEIMSSIEHLTSDVPIPNVATMSITISVETIASARQTSLIQVSEQFLNTHQHIIGYAVPYYENYKKNRI